MTEYERGYLEGLLDENGFNGCQFTENTVDALLGPLDGHHGTYADGVRLAQSKEVVLTLNRDGMVTL